MFHQPAPRPLTGRTFGVTDELVGQSDPSFQHVLFSILPQKSAFVEPVTQIITTSKRMRHDCQFYKDKQYQRCLKALPIRHRRMSVSSPARQDDLRRSRELESALKRLCTGKPLKRRRNSFSCSARSAARKQAIIPLLAVFLSSKGSCLLPDSLYSSSESFLPSPAGLAGLCAKAIQ